MDQVINKDKIKDIKVFKSLKSLDKNSYDTIIFSVIHDKFKNTLKKNYKEYLKNKKKIIVDINGFLPKSDSDFRL